MAQSWQPALLQLVGSEAENDRVYSDRSAALAHALQGQAQPTRAIELVTALGPFLTGEDDAARARATGALAEVVEAVPAIAASEGEVQHLAQFFASRLTDWPAVRGALRGCLALVSRRAGAVPEAAAAAPAAAAAAALPAPDDAAVAEMMRACAGHVFIRALAAPDRQLAFRLLAAALRGYGGALLEANIDLFEYTLTSVDGEKDPRCLLLGFDATRALLSLYHAQPDTALCRERLEEGAEELFEALACYFPVTFTPPPGDPHRITRANLAAALEALLAAEPLFAPHVVPLAADKLSSTLRLAKLDAMALLGACADGYGLAPLAAHVSTIWAALRGELLAAAREGMLPADLAAAEELAAAAGAALQRCVAAFQRPSEGEGGGGMALADAVLADALLTDMLACIRAPGTDPAVHRRSALRAAAGARAARALCAAGGAAAARALSKLLPPLLEVVGSRSGGWQRRCLAWASAAELLEAAAAAPAEAAAEVDAALLQQAVAAAAAALAAAAQTPADEEDEDEEEDEEEGSEQSHAERWPMHPTDCTQQHATAQQQSALAAVLASAPMAASLQPEQLEASVDSALSLLWAAGPSKQRQRVAATLLTALSRGGAAPLLAERALPQLVAALGQPQSSAAALAALQALAAAGDALQLDVLVALDQAIQQRLPAAVGTAAPVDSVALLQQLLAAATAVVSATGAAAAGAAAQAAGGALQLGRHLLDAVLLLPQEEGNSATPALQAACAELAHHAVRGAAADQQQPLAVAAAEALRGEAALGGLQASVCCGVLAALRPEAANSCAGGAAELASLAQRLVQLAVAQQLEGPAARWAGQAAASLLNKWPAADAEALSSCASAAVQGLLFPACGLASDPALPVPAPAAWGCLAAVSRGLAMRGQKEADGAVRRVIASLNAAAQRWQQSPADAPGAAAAAAFLGAVLSGGDHAGLGKQLHATVRPLWQQRLYTAAAGELLPLLQRSQQGGGSGGGGSSQQDPAPATASPVLLLALAHLLRAAPDAVLQQETARMLPWLLQCLAVLQEGPLADGELLLALLLLASDALMTPAGKQLAESELLPRLVPTLLALADYRPLAAVRETALLCLLVLVELPYTSLHPYRRTVAKALGAAVDDDRRAVRLQAARCRQAWTA